MTQQAATVSSVLERPAFGWIDPLSEKMQAAAGKLLHATSATRKVKDVLNGTPMRHRVHPALVVVPLGAWTTAALLDVLESRAPRRQRSGYRASADAAIAFGIAGALPSAASGVADWVDLYDQQRRVGTAHALLNVAALGCYSASYVLRMTSRERRGAARLLSGIGLGIVSLSGSLGGELVYTLGVNVPYHLYPKAPDDWRDVLASAELQEGVPVVVEDERVPVLLLRLDGEVFAVQEWCPHAGGPLSEGKFDGDVVECPWHQSRFCLRDGAPLQGPASVPLRTFAVRDEGGRILIRPSFEGQSWPPAPVPPRTVPEHVSLAEGSGSVESSESQG
jgi:nitrite reductase/ring-hydroxylating ferredoxin subunit/uncharacterized membrane protein